MAKKTSRTSAKISKKASARRATTRRKAAAGSPGAGARSDRKTAKPRLLSGGNPQIPKGYGDAPVQAYIEAMPGWKTEMGRRLDTIITRAVPGGRKAVKWNSPMYGASDEDSGWFLGLHCFTNYIKVAFFRGARLRPAPPIESKHKEVRYLHIHKDGFDEAQFDDWVRQASQVPGERM